MAPAPGVVYFQVLCVVGSVDENSNETGQRGLFPTGCAQPTSTAASVTRPGLKPHGIPSPSP